MTVLRKTVTLNPGESKAVTFEVVPSAGGTYSVNVDGLTGGFFVIEKPADFTVSDLIIEPTEVYVGETVSISVVVTNVGGKAGSYEVTCEVV